MSRDLVLPRNQERLKFHSKEESSESPKKRQRKMNDEITGQKRLVTNIRLNHHQLYSQNLFF